MSVLPSLRETAAQRREELARRWALAAEASPDDARGPRPLLLAQEFLWPLEPLKRRREHFEVPTADYPQKIMLLPGFGAHPLRLRWLARRLEEAGHGVKRWGQGYNLGATADRISAVEQRLVDLEAQAGQKLVLIGWSLGGVMARELAKKHPDKVAKVITMGSPFSGSPRANNGWRAYQAIAGHRVDEPEIDTVVAEKPPVETIAMWSARDGVVNPRSACGKPGERDRAIALRCSHMGFVMTNEALAALLSELDRS